MSYEKQTWQSGDTVTSAKLNHMEDGIASAGGGGLLVTATKDENDVVTLDRKWSEIAAVFCAGGSVVVYDQSFGNVYLAVTKVTNYEGDYSVEDSAGTPYMTDSENGYPSYSDSPI